MDHSKTFKILIKQIGEIEAIDAHTHIINPRLPRRCIVRRWRNNLDDTASIPAHRKAGLDIPPFPHRYVINPSPYAGSLLSDPHENRARRPLVAPHPERYVYYPVFFRLEWNLEKARLVRSGHLTHHRALARPGHAFNKPMLLRVEDRLSFFKAGFQNSSATLHEVLAMANSRP